MRGIRRAAVLGAALAALALPAHAFAATMPANDNRTTPDELRSGDSSLLGVRNFGIDPQLRTRGVAAPYYFNEIGWFSGGSPNDANDPPLTAPPPPAGSGGVAAASTCGSDLQDFGSNTLWFHIHGADGRNFRERTFVVIDGTAAYRLALAVYRGFPPTWHGGSKPPANLIACESQNLGDNGQGAVVSFLANAGQDYYLEVAEDDGGTLASGTIHSLFVRTIDVQAPDTSLIFQNPTSVVPGHTGRFQLLATDLGSGQGRGHNTGTVKVSWDVTFSTLGGTFLKKVVPSACTPRPVRPQNACIETGTRLLRVHWSRPERVTVHALTTDPAGNGRDDRLSVLVNQPPPPPAARTLLTRQSGSSLIVSARCTVPGWIKFFLIGPTRSYPATVRSRRVVIGKGKHRRIRYTARRRFGPGLPRNAFYIVQASCVQNVQGARVASAAQTKLILLR
jgi:hypothetical protein